MTTMLNHTSILIIVSLMTIVLTIVQIVFAIIFVKMKTRQEEWEEVNIKDHRVLKKNQIFLHRVLKTLEIQSMKSLQDIVSMKNAMKSVDFLEKGKAQEILKKNVKSLENQLLSQKEIVGASMREISKLQEQLRINEEKMNQLRARLTLKEKEK